MGGVRSRARAVWLHQLQEAQRALHGAAMRRATLLRLAAGEKPAKKLCLSDPMSTERVCLT